MSRSPISIWFLAGSAVLATQGAQAGESARLVYSRSVEAASCPDETGLRQLVARRLGYDPFVAVSMNTVVVELRGDGDGLKARVYVIRDGNSAGGTRELQSPARDCVDLAATAALAISIAVDPDALERTEAAPAPAFTNSDEPEQPREVEHPAVNTEQPPGAFAPPLQRPGAATTRERVGSVAANQGASNGAAPGTRAIFGVGVAPFFATGPSPAPVLGAAAFLTLRWKTWGFALEPAATLASTKAADTSDSKVRAWTASGSALAGRYFGRAYAGVLFDLAVLNASGDGVDVPKSNHSLLPSVGVRLALDWRLAADWSLIPRVDALFALTRVAMQLNHSVPFETPLAFARIGLAVEHRF